MAQSAPEFVRAVMRALEVSSAAELAEAMRWKRGTERLVAKWLAGDAKPSFDYTVEMAERAGLLSMREGAAADPDRPAPADPLREIAATLGALAQGQQAILQSLGVAVSAPEESRAPRASQSRRKA